MNAGRTGVSKIELQKWTQINPAGKIAAEKSEKDPTGKRNQIKPPLPAFNTHQSKLRSGNQCVYCEDDKHRAINCTKVTCVHERQKILSERTVMGARGSKHRHMQLRHLETCRLPALKEPTRIK